MIAVLGASGQVGGAIVAHLLEQKTDVKAVVHSEDKADDLKKKGAQVAIADAFDAAALKSAFADAETVFVLTPETGKSNDVIGDTEKILANYRAAVAANPSVKYVVGLSSMGAQHPVGNLKMSSLLERAFDGLAAQTVFVRPAYYYSNWQPYGEAVKKDGVLPTFYPVDLQIPMISPLDVAAFIAGVLLHPKESAPLIELIGPEKLSSADVARAFGDVLKRDVKAQEIPKEKWDDQLKQMGFTDDATKNFNAMTETVISENTDPEGTGEVVALQTTLTEYLAVALKE